MNKWMSVALLAAIVCCGCESMKKDKSDTSSEPKKMSIDANKKCADGKSCCDKK